MAQIKKDTSLRKAILQAAVTGKLVSTVLEPVETTIETGRQLLNRIIEERNKKLLEETKKNHTDLQISTKSAGKKSDLRSKSQIRVNKKELPPITEDEIPFEIPENWCWCRLGDVIDLLSGRDLAPSSYNSISKGIPYMTGASNFENEELIVNRWTDKPATISTKGDLLITCKGTIGELAFNKVGDVHIARQIMAIRKSEYINLKFLKYFLMCRIKEVQKQAKSMIPGISREDMLGFCLPLPPLAVQNAIVAKLEQVLPLVDSYENAVLQKEELKGALKDKMKKAILQEAVQGKLVPQIAGEGNAKDLLEEIKKNHTDLQISTKSAGKKSVTKKELPPITEEEIPFEIPENWCWCRLGDLVPFGQCENAEPDEIEDNAWILDLEDIEKDSGKILQFKTKKEVESKSTKHVFKTGFVLYSKLRPYLNKCVIAPKDGYCTSEIIPLDFGKLVNNKYAQIFLMSPYFVDYTNSLSFGVKMPRLGTEDGKKALFPLPPLAEQKRIAAALEELLPLCEKL